MNAILPCHGHLCRYLHHLFLFCVCMCKCNWDLLNFFFFLQWTNVSIQLYSWKYPTLLWLKRTNTYCICKRFVLKHFKSLMMNKLFHPHHGEPNFYWHSRNTFSEDVEVWVSKLNCSSTFVCVCVYFCEDDSVSDKTSPTYNSPGTLQP